MLPSAAEMPPWAATVWLRVGKHLGDAGGGESGFGQSERGAQAGAAGAHDQHVVRVIDELVVLHVAPRSARRSSA